MVAGLRRDGVFVTDLTTLGIVGVDGDSILENGAAIAATLANRVAVPGHPRPAAIIGRPGDLLDHPTLYRWGLHPTLLRIVEAYLRQPVAYDGPVIFHTEASGQEIGTRRWHLDREDRRVVKVALYLHDVDDAAGPFQILPQTPQNTSGRYDYTAFDTATLDRVLDAQSASREPVTCTGAAGTVVFAETARFFHRGKPPTRHHRTAIFYGYFARPPRNPFFCERSQLSRAQIVRLTEDLSPRQRASALWRDTVPWLLRLIPAYKT